MYNYITPAQVLNEAQQSSDEVLAAIAQCDDLDRNIRNFERYIGKCRELVGSDIIESAARLEAAHVLVGICSGGEVRCVNEGTRRADEIVRNGGTLWSPAEMT